MSDAAPALVLTGARRPASEHAAVLVLHGAQRTELLRARRLASALAGRRMLVAVDGGLAAFGRALRPDLFVGDGDSCGRAPRDVPSVRYDPDKDFSDLAGALVEVARRGVGVVLVAGLLGGRLDHEWSNLLELVAHAGRFAAIVAPTPRGTVVVTRRGCRARTVRRRTVSLFALGSAATVSLRGTRWELERRRIRPGSLGLSNVTGKQLALTVHAGTAVLVFIPPRGGAGRT